MKIKKVLLKDVATISSGVTIREKVKHDPEGDTHVIQMRDLIDHYPFINTESAALTKGDKFKPRHILAVGDLLFVAKGQNNFAYPIYSDLKDFKVVAVSFFFVIKKKPLPYDLESLYLGWYINAPDAQRYFKKCSEGTNIRNINKKALEELPIPIPSVEMQKTIMATSDLLFKEEYFQKQLMEKRKQFITYSLLNKVR